MKKLENPSTRNQLKALLFTTAISTSMVMPAMAYAQDADDEIEEVVVTGIRGSLVNAAAIKRNADQMVDAISAEDIGLFSDNNIGEALSRIPGIQLERSGGEGFRISIRGLGPRFVRTTLNGRSALSSPGGEGGSDARGFSFNIIPSEVITKASVSKSTIAKDIEGGIGGVVNLYTVRPIDLANQRDEDLYISGSMRGTYNTLNDKISPRGSFFVNKRINDQFAVFFATAIEERDTMRDSTESQDFQVDKFTLPAGTIVNGEALDDDKKFYAAQFDGSRNIRREESRSRQTFTAGAQWQPTDNLNIYADWTHGREQNDQQQYRSWLRVEDVLDRFDDKDSPTIITNININTDDAFETPDGDYSDGTVTDYTFENFTEDKARQTVDIANLYVGYDDIVNVGGLNAEWDDGNGFKVTADFGYASQRRTYLQTRMQADLDYSNLHDPARFPLEDLKTPYPDGDKIDDSLAGINGSFDITDGLPIVMFEDVNGVPFDVTDATDLNFDQDRQSYRVEDNEELSFRLDFEKEINEGIIDNLNIGFSWRDKQGFRTQKRTEGNGQDRNDSEYADIGIAQFGTKMITNFMSNVDHPDFQHSFVVPDFDGWIAADPAGTFAQDPKEGVVQQKQEYIVDETVTSGYMMMSFSNDDVKFPFRGNFGARVVNTKQSTSGLVGVEKGNDFIALDEANPYQTTVRDYTDILPSANIAFELRDDVILRFAASKTLSRPDPVDMRQSIDLDDYDGKDDFEGKSGNPDLEAYRTANYDAALEWYPESGGAYAIGLYYKELEGYIALGEEIIDIDLSTFADGVIPDPLGIEEFLIERPVNTAGGTIKGFELSMFQPFDAFTDGPLKYFGVNASLTYIDAKLEALVGNNGSVSLRGSSKWSGNVVTYFEKDALSVRLAYNMRSDYLHREAHKFEKFDEFYKGKSYLNLNIGWNFKQGMQLRFVADNLTNQQVERVYKTQSHEYMSNLRNNGRTFGLEFRFKM